MCVCVCVCVCVTGNMNLWTGEKWNMSVRVELYKEINMIL